MCRRAFLKYPKVHYVCVACRQSNKYAWDSATRPCPRCGKAMAHAGHDFAAPPRRDNSGWAAVEAVLGTGLRYDGFDTCGCGRSPRFRPRTRSQVKARRIVAERDGLNLAEAIEMRNV